MRIAFVTYALEAGGVETFLRRIALGMSAAGHAVRLVETEARGQWAAEFERAGVHVVDVLPSSWRSKATHCRAIAASLCACDAVVFNDAPWGQAGSGLLPARCACLSIVHGDMGSMYRNAAGTPEDSDALVGVGPRVARRLRETNGVDPARVQMIPYGVEVPERPPARRYRRAGDPLQVCYVGRLEDVQKGVLRLPSILAAATASGAEVQLSVIGDGPDRTRLAEEIDRFGLASRTTFYGLLPPAAARSKMAEHDVLILPSNFEGLPIVVLEAMAEGVVPVVSFLPEMTAYEVEAGRTGFLPQPADTEGFAQALVLLFREPDRLRAMSEAAWKDARERFSVQRMCSDYETLLAGLVARRAQTPCARSGSLQWKLLGDFPNVPLRLVRPLRKLRRVVPGFAPEGES